MADGTGLREEPVDHESGRRSHRRTGVPAWLRRAGLVARTNLRRQYRTARSNPWFAFAYLFSLAFGLFVAVGRAPVPGFAGWPYPGGYALGRQFAAGDTAVVGRVRGFGGVLFVLLALVTVLKEATDGAMDAHVDSLVLAAGARSVAVGGVLWSLLLTGSQFGVIVIAGAVAFGVGAGSGLAGVGLVLAGLCLLVAAVPVGFVVAVGIRLAFQRVPLLHEHRLLVGAPLALVYFGLFARVRASMTLLADSPLGRFADPGFVLVGAVPPGRAAVAVAFAAVGAVGATALAVPLSARLWLGDDPRGDETSTADAVHTRERRLDRLVGRPVAAVARSVWLRVRREPRSLLFAAMSAAIAGTVAVDLVGRAPTALAAVVAVYGGATVGMGATLNPLGAAGVGLPAALTTHHGGRSLVRGYALSAALPGAPLVAAASGLAGLATGLPLALVAATAALGAVLATVGAVVSLVVGLAIPNVDGLRPTGSGLRPPKLLATTAFLLVMATLGSPALAGVGLAGEAPTLTGALAGVGVSATLAVLVGALAYRRALRTVAGYQME